MTIDIPQKKTLKAIPAPKFISEISDHEVSLQITDSSSDKDDSGSECEKGQSKSTQSHKTCYNNNSNKNNQPVYTDKHFTSHHQKQLRLQTQNVPKQYKLSSLIIGEEPNVHNLKEKKLYAMEFPVAADHYHHNMMVPEISKDSKKNFEDKENAKGIKVIFKTKSKTS